MKRHGLLDDAHLARWRARMRLQDPDPLVRTRRELEEAHGEIDRQLTRMRQLNELALAVPLATAPIDVVREVIDTMATTLPIEHAVALLWHQRELQMVVHERGETHALAPGSTLARAFQDLRIPLDVTVVEHPAECAFGASLAAAGARFPLVLVPLGYSSGETHGLIALSGLHASSECFTADHADMVFLQLVGRHATAGLKIVSDAVLLAERVEERTRQLTDANAELARALSRQRETQELLVQAEKMSAIGQLAAGLAHEINNPLGVILGFSQGLEKRFSDDERLTLPVSSIVREAVRCRKLVQELLTFSRTAAQSSAPVDVNEVVSSAAILLATQAKAEGVALALDLGADLPATLGNRTHLEQVVVNLGANAVQASGRGQKVTLRTRVSSCHTLLVQVEDEGAGITEEHRPRIFEPFFTTKAVGQGTGLGLSLVWEIVQQHGGAVHVDTLPGRGSLFSVTLPASSAS